MELPQVNDSGDPQRENKTFGSDVLWELNLLECSSGGFITNWPTTGACTPSIPLHGSFGMWYTFFIQPFPFSHFLIHEKDPETFGKLGTQQIVRLIFLCWSHSAQIEMRYLTSLNSKLPSIEQSRYHVLGKK